MPKVLGWLRTQEVYHHGWKYMYHVHANIFLCWNVKPLLGISYSVFLFLYLDYEPAFQECAEFLVLCSTGHSWASSYFSYWRTFKQTLHDIIYQLPGVHLPAFGNTALGNHIVWHAVYFLLPGMFCSHRSRVTSSASSPSIFNYFITTNLFYGRKKI